MRRDFGTILNREEERLCTNIVNCDILLRDAIAERDSTPVKYQDSMRYEAVEGLCRALTDASITLGASLNRIREARSLYNMRKEHRK